MLTPAGESIVDTIEVPLIFKKKLEQLLELPFQNAAAKVLKKGKR